MLELDLKIYTDKISWFYDFTELEDELLLELKKIEEARYKDTVEFEKWFGKQIEDEKQKL